MANTRKLGKGTWADKGVLIKPNPTVRKFSPFFCAVFAGDISPLSLMSIPIGHQENMRDTVAGDRFCLIIAIELRPEWRNVEIISHY